MAGNSDVYAVSVLDLRPEFLSSLLVVEKFMGMVIIFLMLSEKPQTNALRFFVLMLQFFSQFLAIFVL